MLTSFSLKNNTAVVISYGSRQDLTAIECMFCPQNKVDNGACTHARMSVGIQMIVLHETLIERRKYSWLYNRRWCRITGAHERTQPSRKFRDKMVTHRHPRARHQQLKNVDTQSDNREPYADMSLEKDKCDASYSKSSSLPRRRVGQCTLFDILPGVCNTHRAYKGGSAYFSMSWCHLWEGDAMQVALGVL